MQEINLGSLLAICSTIITLGTAYLTVRKIQADNTKEREREAARILQEAKEEDAKNRKELEVQIDALSTALENLEISVNKDFDHIRETYNGEIRNLGQKIEDLRSELRNQHGQLVQLLTKMIDNRD